MSCIDQDQMVSLRSEDQHYYNSCIFEIFIIFRMFPQGSHFDSDPAKHRQPENTVPHQITQQQSGNVRRQIYRNFPASMYPQGGWEFARMPEISNLRFLTPNMEFRSTFLLNQNFPPTFIPPFLPIYPLTGSFLPATIPGFLPNYPSTSFLPAPFPRFLPNNRPTTDFPPPPFPRFLPNNRSTMDFPPPPIPRFLPNDPSTTDFPPAPFRRFLPNDPSTTNFPRNPFPSSSPNIPLAISSPPIPIPPFLPKNRSISPILHISPGLNIRMASPRLSRNPTLIWSSSSISETHKINSSRSNTSSPHRIAVDSGKHKVSEENNETMILASSRKLLPTGSVKQKQQRSHRYSRRRYKRLRKNNDSDESVEEERDIRDENVEQNKYYELKNRIEKWLDSLDLNDDDDNDAESVDSDIVTQLTDQIRQLKMKIAIGGGKKRYLLQNIQQLNDKIVSLQSSSPSSSSSSASRIAANTINQKARMEQFLERFTKERAHRDYRFWIMAKMMQSLMETLIEKLCHLSSDKVLAEMNEWLQENFQPSIVRSNASSLLTFLITEVGRSNDPNALKKYIQRKLSQR